MKRLLALLLLAAALPLRAQDTAAVIVEQYLKMLNFDALPKDSLLVVETTISFDRSPDTFLMRRYYQTGGMQRIEVWHADTITTGLCTNGGKRHRQYMSLAGWWESVSRHDLLLEMQSYDCRSALYQWEHLGVKLSYRGIVEVDGVPLQVVRAEQRNRYQRLYYFDPSNHLLVMVLERGDRPTGDVRTPDRLLVPRTDYKFYHEYLPVGECLIPSEESFRRGDMLTIMRSTAHFEPRNNLLFNSD